jgi:hypothetical protein
MTGLNWLLVLNFPHGGSTAFAELLLTARGTIRLHQSAEGQWLLPVLCADKLRWDPELAFDPMEVRNVWTRTALEQCRLLGIRSDEALVVEKSPPNMCRYRHLLGALKDMRTTVVVLTRDPYATCASWHRHYGPADIAREWGWPDREPKDEQTYLQALASIWLVRARMLERARPETMAWIRYEDFAEQPSREIFRLSERLPQLRNVNLTASLQVKDYAPQPFRNMNADLVSQLRPAQKAAISQALAQDSDLVESFGYRLHE